MSFSLIWLLLRLAINCFERVSVAVPRRTPGTCCDSALRALCRSQQAPSAHHVTKSLSPTKTTNKKPLSTNPRQDERLGHAANDIKHAVRSRSMPQVIVLAQRVPIKVKVAETKRLASSVNFAQPPHWRLYLSYQGALSKRHACALRYQKHESQGCWCHSTPWHLACRYPLRAKL